MPRGRSVVVQRTPGSTLDDRGVQDPRVIRDPSTGTYWLTASSIGSSYIGTLIARSTDGLQWEKVGRCDADHADPLRSFRVDPISNRSCNYGRAASILWRRSGEHVAPCAGTIRPITCAGSGRANGYAARGVRRHRL